MYPDDTEIQGWIKEYSFNEIQVPGVYIKKNIKRDIQDKKVITIMGRLDNEHSSLMLKGLGDNLFEVLKEVLNQRDDVYVVVVGAGKRLKHYQQEMSPFSDRISFMGWMTDFDLQLSQASFVIGGSGLNGVIMDSVPNQIPVLISKNLTGSLWRHKENCLVYDPADTAQWKDVISLALDQPKNLQIYASKAKADLNEFALPQYQAGQKWISKINDFLKIRT